MRELSSHVLAAIGMMNFFEIGFLRPPSPLLKRYNFAVNRLCALNVLDATRTIPRLTEFVFKPRHKILGREDGSLGQVSSECNASI